MRDAGEILVAAAAAWISFNLSTWDDAVWVRESDVVVDRK